MKKQIGTVVMAVLLVPALILLGFFVSAPSESQAMVQEEPCPCSKNTEIVSSLSENTKENSEAGKAVALVLASDDFRSLRRSIQEDGLHFDAGHQQAFLISECEEHRTYLVYFGFDPSVTGSRVGIIAFVDVSEEIILTIARVDQSSPNPQGLRTVTVQSPTGETEEFTITWDIEPHNFDWGCFLNCCCVPPPEICISFFVCCVGFPSPYNPCCPALLACMGIQGIVCAIACA